MSGFEREIRDNNLCCLTAGGMSFEREIQGDDTPLLSEHRRKDFERRSAFRDGTKKSLERERETARDPRFVTRPRVERPTKDENGDGKGPAVLSQDKWSWSTSEWLDLS